jgi:hypothetical protein
LEQFLPDVFARGTDGMPHQETDMATATSDFEGNVRTYRQVLPKLLKEQAEGKFAVVGRAEFCGVHASRSEAISEGYRQFGHQEFLVQKVSKDDLALELDMLETCRS